MYAYYVLNTYNEHQGMQSVRLGIGERWSHFEPGTATIWVHPDIDFHTVRGDLFLRGKVAKLMECPPNYQIKESGVFILARNYNDALKLLRP